MSLWRLGAKFPRLGKPEEIEKRKPVVQALYKTIENNEIEPEKLPLTLNEFNKFKKPIPVFGDFNSVITVLKPELLSMKDDGRFVRAAARSIFDVRLSLLALDTMLRKHVAWVETFAKMLMAEKTVDCDKIERGQREKFYLEESKQPKYDGEKALDVLIKDNDVWYVIRIWARYALIKKRASMANDSSPDAWIEQVIHEKCRVNYFKSLESVVLPDVGDNFQSIMNTLLGWVDRGLITSDSNDWRFNFNNLVFQTDDSGKKAKFINPLQLFLVLVIMNQDQQERKKLPNLHSSVGVGLKSEVALENQTVTIFDDFYAATSNIEVKGAPPELQAVQELDSVKQEVYLNTSEAHIDTEPFPFSKALQAILERCWEENGKRARMYDKEFRAYRQKLMQLIVRWQIPYPYRAGGEQNKLKKNDVLQNLRGKNKLSNLSYILTRDDCKILQGWKEMTTEQKRDAITKHTDSEKELFSVGEYFQDVQRIAHTFGKEPSFSEWVNQVHTILPQNVGDRYLADGEENSILDAQALMFLWAAFQRQVYQMATKPESIFVNIVKEKESGAKMSEEKLVKIMETMSETVRDDGFTVKVYRKIDNAFNFQDTNFTYMQFIRIIESVANDTPGDYRRRLHNRVHFMSKQEGELQIEGEGCTQSSVKNTLNEHREWYSATNQMPNGVEGKDHRCVAKNVLLLDFAKNYEL